MNQADINCLTTQNIMDADTLVVAQSVYNSPNYLANLAEFAGGPSLPDNKPGRFLEARLNAVHEALPRGSCHEGEALGNRSEAFYKGWQGKASQRHGHGGRCL